MSRIGASALFTGGGSTAYRLHHVVQELDFVWDEVAVQPIAPRGEHPVHMMITRIASTQVSCLAGSLSPVSVAKPVNYSVVRSVRQYRMGDLGYACAMYILPDPPAVYRREQQSISQESQA